MHINDITADIVSEIRLFADDCVFYHEIKDIEDTLKLQRDIDRLGNWVRELGMRFQPVNCNMIQLTKMKVTNKIQASYTLEGTVLENVENIKYLGVTMKWNTHINNICTKATYKTTPGFLRRTLFSCPQDIIKEWCVQFLNMKAQFGTLIPKNFKMKNRAARFVTRKYVYQTGSTMTIEMGISYDNRPILLCIQRSGYLQMTLFSRLGAAESSTLWPFIHPLPVKTPMKIASFLELSGTGITSLILRLYLLDCRMIVCLSLLLL